MWCSQKFCDDMTRSQIVASYVSSENLVFFQNIIKEVFYKNKFKLLKIYLIIWIQNTILPNGTTASKNILIVLIYIFFIILLFYSIIFIFNVMLIITNVKEKKTKMYEFNIHKKIAKAYITK